MSGDMLDVWISHDNLGGQRVRCPEQSLYLSRWEKLKCDSSSKPESSGTKFWSKLRVSLQCCQQRASSVWVQINRRCAWDLAPTNFRNVHEHAHQCLRLGPDATGRFNYDLVFIIFPYLRRATEYFVFTKICLSWLGFKLNGILYFSQLVGLMSLSPALRRRALKWRSLHLSHRSAVNSSAAGFYVIWVCNGARPQAVCFPKNVAEEQEHRWSR